MLKLNGRVVKEYGKKNFEEVIDYYMSALGLWFGYLFVRYNLVCAYVLIGEKNRSLVLLKQLKTEGCINCFKWVE